MRSFIGPEFVLPRAAAQHNRTLRDMLDMEIGLYEALSNTINLHFRAAVVQIIVDYLMLAHRATDSATHYDAAQFLRRLPPELSLEVLVAADFLGA